MSQAEGVSTDGCSIPADIESAPAKLLYLYLDVHGEATMDQISDELALPLITICGLLETLEDRGFLRRSGDRYRLVS